MYKKELVVSFVSLLLIYFVSAGLTVKAQYTEDGKAFILASPINIISPSNITYSSNLLTLNVTFKLMLGVNCTELSYSIDGKDNITITPTVSRQLIEATITYENGTSIIGNATFVPYVLNGWAILPELAEGSHNITVYGKYNANNIIGLDNRTVYFTINSNPAQENWSEVARFTEDSKFLQKAFTIEHVEWRIRWEYEPDPEISEEHPALYVYVWDKEFPDTYFETILKKGTNETSGTLYIHNRKGTFFLGVIRTVTSFTLIIEQDLTSIPEFPSWTILLLFLIATLTITLIKRRKFIVY